MAFTVQIFINKVRDLVSDTEAPYRWDDVTIIDWINEGLAALFDNHPELYYTSAVAVDPPDAVSGVADSVDITLNGQKVVSNYAAYRCLLRDNEDPETLAMMKNFLELYSMGV